MEKISEIGDEINKHRLANNIFDIDLIAAEIWKYFNVPTLLQTSLVCKQFCVLSRQFLRKSEYCSIQLLDKNPCRALQTVNNLIANSEDVCYNGLRHKRKLYDKFKNTKWYLPLTCDENCLGNQLEDSVDVRQLYSNLLEKIEFRFVCFRPRVNMNCPFFKLIKIVLIDRAHEITELHLCGETFYYEGGHYERMNLWKFDQFSQSVCFSNLKTVKLPRNPFIAVKLIQSAPKLKKIIGRINNIGRTFENMGIADKEVAITRLNVFSTQEILRLAIMVKPKLEKLTLPYPKVEEFPLFQSSLQMLSSTICKYLRKLNCSIYVLTLLANGSEMPRFLNVKSLKLSNNLKNQSFQESVNCLKSVEFRRSFPNVERVCLHRHWNCHPCATTMTIYPFKENFPSYSTTTLELDLSHFETTPILSTIFPKVKTLKLDNSTRANLPYLLEINPEWCDLEKIILWGSLKRLQLDELFCYLIDHSAPPDGGSSSNANNLKPRRNLKTVVISGIYPCSLLDCNELENVDCFLVSTNVAKLISTQLPGFTIQVKTESRQQCYCYSCIFRPKVDKYQHIRPFARIWKTSLNDEYYGRGMLSIWNLQF